MAIYDINGDVLDTAYGVDGNSLSHAYDLTGDQIFPDGPPSPVTLKVMSYNVQWFTKINSQQAMQNAIIAAYTPDVIGFQEFTKTATIPTVGQNMLSAYPYVQLSSHYNYMGLASKTALSNPISVDYVTQDTAGETEIRAYQKCYINVGGRQIAWFNTHLSYKNSAPKYAQMAELFQAAELEEYAIITGDFNSVALADTDNDYINMYKQFVDAGYNLANNSPTAGFTKTFSSQSTASSLADLMTTPDTIIVSGNIDIDSVVFDTTKLSYLDGNPIDHIPLIASLTIN